MPHPQLDELIGRLPPEAAACVRRSQRADPLRPADRSNFLGEACAKVGFVDGKLGLASRLTPGQRALAEIAAFEDHYNGYGGMPKTAEARRRWLGLNPPGILEQPAGLGDPEPLWHALQSAALADGVQDREKQRRSLAILAGLSVERRLDFFLGQPNDYGISADGLLPAIPRVHEFVEGEASLPTWADRVAAVGGVPIQGGVPDLLRANVFIALMKAKIPIEPRWDVLFPKRFGARPVEMLQAAPALPEPRRAAAILRSLSRDHFADETALELLAKFPSDALTRFVLSKECWGNLPRATRIASLRKIGKRQALVRDALRAALKGEPTPLVLHVKRRTRPTTLAQLTPGQRLQFQAAAGGYGSGDGAVRRTPADWFLSIAELVDASGQPAYELLDLMADSGVVYRAGTTEVVALTIQTGFETQDRPLADALEQALHEERARSGTKKKIPKGSRSARKAPRNKA